MTENDLDVIPSLPKGGPLAPYRSQASFDWRRLKLFFEDADLIKYKEHIWNTMRQDPLFISRIEDLPIIKQKELAQKKVHRLKEFEFLTDKKLLKNPMKRLMFDEALVMFDNDTNVKFSLHISMFQDLMKLMGSERHSELVKKAENFEIFGCFALTEMRHGSNTKDLKTTAHYDPKTEEFVINTPAFEDSKIWVGNLGKTATHAAVYAQLITPDGVSHGMHIFIVPVRDPITNYALPGVIVGDLGPKLGLNGVDNGFVTFNHVRVPRENLLNRTGDVTPEGLYITPFKDPKKRFGVSLGTLSNGRVALTSSSNCFMIMALTIAIRYAAIRRQFGAEGSKEEMPIIEYQLHQYRLMPLLAVCYVIRNYSLSLFSNLVEFYIGIMSQDTSDRQAEFGKEIHALSSASKPYSSWIAQSTIQECREACGGLGYLKATRLGYLRDTNDPILTFEGDNNVLQQQTSNHLISGYDDYLKSRSVPETPLETMKFLENFDHSLNQKFVASSELELLTPATIMQMFDWLLCYMLKISHQKLEVSLKSGKDLFTARNDNQIFYSKTLAIIFIERQIIQRFIAKINENSDMSLKPVLDKILFLAALHMLEKHIALFYQGGYFAGPKSDRPVFIIRETILKLCREMKSEAVALVDAIAPPDFVLNSALGDSSGEAYKKLYSMMTQSPYSMEPMFVERPRGPISNLKPKKVKSNL